MYSKILSKEDKKELNSKNYLLNLKSNCVLKKILANIGKNKSFKIIKCNKKIQKRLNINVKDYKEYSERYTPIEIEIIPIKNEYSPFINIEGDKSYYHIYFNDNEKEIKKYSLKKDDNISKIKIKIDYEVKSFEKLFCQCKCIESINFKKFYRNNITQMRSMFLGCSSLKKLLNFNSFNTDNATNMSDMFYGCSSLKELNLNNFNTTNVFNMKFMFSGCSSLKELNLNNFNTINTTRMADMFHGCSSLQTLNLNNFNTNNVTNMADMFWGCSSLKELNLNNFNTNNVTDMGYMFEGCSSLKELNFKNFSAGGVTNMKSMFSGCSNELIMKIKILIILILLV